MGGSTPHRRRWIARRLRRPVFVAGLVAVAVLAPATAGVLRSDGSPSVIRGVLRSDGSPSVIRAEGFGRATQGGAAPITKPPAVTAVKGKLPKPRVLSRPTELHLTKAHDAVFDVRTLKSTVVRRERLEHAAP